MLDTNPIANRARKARRACERSRSARARAESAEVLSLAVVPSRGAEVVLAVGRGLDVCVEEESCACTVAAAASKASEASASETRLAVPESRLCSGTRQMYQSACKALRWLASSLAHAASEL